LRSILSSPDLALKPRDLQEPGQLSYQDLEVSGQRHEVPGRFAGPFFRKLGEAAADLGGDLVEDRLGAGAVPVEAHQALLEGVLEDGQVAVRNLVSFKEGGADDFCGCFVHLCGKGDAQSGAKVRVN
jgi:hypothetical protein